MTNPISSPDHVLVCGERVERSTVDRERAAYGQPLGVVRVTYWPAHDRQWTVFFCITRPSGVTLHYQSSAAALRDAISGALYECTIDDCEIVLRSLRAMGEVAHA